MFDILFPWIKALHIMAVISWMAGLFYLPRLFVHHVERAQGNAEMETVFQMMEVKLLRVIMNPAMIVSWVCGILLAIFGGRAIHAEPWFLLKVILVLFMTGFHHWCIETRKELEKGKYLHEGRYYRLMNEVPTVLMILIVILVVVKPF